MKRIGKFEITDTTRATLDDEKNLTELLAIFKDTIPFNVEHAYWRDTVIYTVYHPSFREIKEGTLLPFYEVELQAKDKDGKREIKVKFTEISGNYEPKNIA